MKYKLIKEYPGSPKLGTITDRTMYFPEYYPSFWQPVIEKMFMSVDNNIITTYKPKAKQPLFTTEDAVNIFEGDTIYGVNNDWKVFSHYTDLQNKVKSWGLKPVF